jgi:hypothetical protein
MICCWTFFLSVGLLRRAACLLLILLLPCCYPTPVEIK